MSPEQSDPTSARDGLSSRVMRIFKRLGILVIALGVSTGLLGALFEGLARHAVSNVLDRENEFATTFVDDYGQEYSKCLYWKVGSGTSRLNLDTQARLFLYQGYSSFDEFVRQASESTTWNHDPLESRAARFMRDSLRSSMPDDSDRIRDGRIEFLRKKYPRLLTYYIEETEALGRPSRNFFDVSDARGRLSPPLSSSADDEHDVDLLPPCIREAATGSSNASVGLAAFYKDDQTKHLEWLKKAADQNDVFAQMYFADLLREGKGVVKNETLALSYYASAAIQGASYAQWRAGEMLRESDTTRAVQYFEESARQGNCRAASSLADLYSDLGFQSDYPSFYPRRRMNRVNPSTLYSVAYYWSLIADALNQEAEQQGVKLSGFSDVDDNPHGLRPPPAKDGSPRLIWTPNCHWTLIRETIQGPPVALSEQLEARIGAAERHAVQEMASVWQASRRDPSDTSKVPARDQDASSIERVSTPWVPTHAAACRTTKEIELSAQTIYELASPAIWKVYSYANALAREWDQPSVQGSAVAINRNELLTNCHVVLAGSIIEIRGANAAHEATLKSADPSSDRCILSVPSDLPAYLASFRREDDVRVGERVYSLGAPRDLEATLGDGIVSALRVVDGFKVLQTTAPISPGSSGGALLDRFGNLAGITTFNVDRSQSLNFSVPAMTFCN